MADISLDLNKASSTYKDYILYQNDLVLTTDADSNGTNNILQDILQRMSFFLGEWFLDNTFGVPWYQQILVKNPDNSKIDILLLNVILNTPGVQLVSTYKFTPNLSARTLTVQFNAQTTSGTVDYTGTVLAS